MEATTTATSHQSITDEMTTDLPITMVTAEIISCWQPPHEVRDWEHVADIFASMDSDPDRLVWIGPPLVADIAGDTLYTGTHRQAAIKRILDTYDVGWQVPVVDLWDIIDQGTALARTDVMRGGEDWLSVITEMVAASDFAAAIGWDRE